MDHRKNPARVEKTRQAPAVKYTLSDINVQINKGLGRRERSKGGLGIIGTKMGTGQEHGPGSGRATSLLLDVLVTTGWTAFERTPL